MLYLYGALLPDKKKLIYALTNIHGIGYFTALKICQFIGLGKNYYIGNLTDAHISKICEYIESHHLIEGDLRKDVYLNITRLSNIGSNRGIRHSMGLPVRGQRTHTNSKTQKRLSRRYKI